MGLLEEVLGFILNFCWDLLSCLEAGLLMRYLAHPFPVAGVDGMLKCVMAESVAGLPC